MPRHAITLLLATTLCACQATPAFAPPANGEPLPKASQTLGSAAKQASQAQAQVWETGRHLDYAASAATLPQAKTEISAAQKSNAAAAQSLAVVGDLIGQAQPQAKAQEQSGAHCAAQLQAAKDYAWLRAMLIAIGSAAFALVILLLAALAFESVAASTFLAAIPVIGGIITGTRSALLLLIAELAIACATCAYMAAHIAAAVNWGFACAVSAAGYLALRAIGWRRIWGGWRAMAGSSIINI